MWGKSSLALVFLLVVTAANSGATDGFRIFTDRQGRAVSAKIINVDAQRGLVELQLENKRRKKIKPSIFCEKDQTYIRDWQSLRMFNSSSSFKVELKKKVVESWTEKGSVQRDFERVMYEMVLMNRGAEPLENLEVAYNIFYEQEQLATSGQYTDKHCTKGRIQREQVAPRSSNTLNSESVVVFDQHLSGGYDGYVGGLPERQEGDIKGIWLRVTLTMPSGASAMREFLSPKSLKSHHSWQEPESTESANEKGKKKRKKGERGA
jgi:hypothetical protein